MIRVNVTELKMNGKKTGKNIRKMWAKDKVEKD